MKDLHLQFRPLAEFLLDFIHKSPSFTLDFVGEKGEFKLYKYRSDFVLTRLLYTLYRVDFVDVDIYINSNSTYTKLHLFFDVHSVFPSVRIECTISDCDVFNLKYYYINNDDNE